MMLARYPWRRLSFSCIALESDGFIREGQRNRESLVLGRVARGRGWHFRSRLKAGVAECSLHCIASRRSDASISRRMRSAGRGCMITITINASDTMTSPRTTVLVVYE